MINGFTVIEGGGSREKGVAHNIVSKEDIQPISHDLKYTVQDYQATLSNKGKYEIKDENGKQYIVQIQDGVGDFPIISDTQNGKKEAYGNIRHHFNWGQTEIKNINLGLQDRDQPDIALSKDIHNVKVKVNGYEHTYNYNQQNKDPFNVDQAEGEETFNVGVKFKNKVDGSYNRAIYTSDYEYDPDDKSNELKVYVTYELKMIQSNTNLKAKINSIAEYHDAKYKIEKIGTQVDDNGNIKEETVIPMEKVREAGTQNKYSKKIIYCNLELEPQQPKSVFVKFELSKENVVNILSDRNSENKAKELLNNIAEIESYSILKDNKPYAGIDINSNPGNCTIEDSKTYENDTSAAPGLQLELVDAREMTGKVFEDEVQPENGQKKEDIMTGKERKGDGTYKEGEPGIGGVSVTLKEEDDTGSGMTYKAVTVPEDGPYHITKEVTKKTEGENPKDREYTFTATRVTEGQDENNPNIHQLKKGDFYIIGYIPGKYTLTYTWGDQTYTVQNYKGTIYNDKERQKKTRWWYVEKYNPDGTPKDAQITRDSDAIDNYATRIKIDNQTKEMDQQNNINHINQAYQQESSIITKMDSITPPMEIDVEYRTTYSDSKGDKYAYCIDNIDFGIVERAKQNLVLTKRISSLKATLANGQVIVDMTIDKEGKVTGDRSGITYMKPNPNIEPNNGFIKLELDNELIQGTKLEVGYSIEATNNSESDYIPKEYKPEEGKEAVFYKYGEITEDQELVTISPTGIIDYLDRNWSFDQKANQAWQVMTANGEDKENNISKLVDKETVIQGADSTIGEKMILYTKNLQEKKISPGKSESVTINVSKTLTTTDQISLDNETEEVIVTKTGGSTLQTIPGNYVPGSGSQEDDDSMAETAIVTPATGENLNYIIPIIIGATALIILGAGIIMIKKKAI